MICSFSNLDKQSWSSHLKLFFLGYSLQPSVVTNHSLAVFTKNIFAIWWDPAYDHKADAKRMADNLISVRDDCLNNFGMKDARHPGSGFYFNVFIWREQGYLGKSDWCNCVPTDPFGYHFVTIHYTHIHGFILYHEAFHIFQSTSPPGNLN